MLSSISTFVKKIYIKNLNKVTFAMKKYFRKILITNILFTTLYLLITQHQQILITKCKQINSLKKLNKLHKKF